MVRRRAEACAGAPLGTGVVSAGLLHNGASPCRRIAALVEVWGVEKLLAVAQGPAQYAQGGACLYCVFHRLCPACLKPAFSCLVRWANMAGQKS